MSPTGPVDSADTALITWANALTLLRAALAPIVVLLLLNQGASTRWWAFGLFLFAASTDSVDGWVARRSKISRWGQLADPAADKALIVTSLAALAALGELPWWAVIVIVVREIAVSAQRWVLSRRGRVLPASLLGKAKTVTQIVAVTLYLLPGLPSRLRASGLAVAVLLTLVSGMEYVLRGERLSRAG
ncbi:MAG: CDP-diacylglycerol--glycerol-3-phosphate 3-phosphatidyltransferase [Egibacteraceae bacterium]